MSEIERFDVVVVGGGAAGLSAGVVLARARRSVLVVDAGRPRNAPAAGVHSFLTRDGMAPADLVAAGRAEVRSFGGRVREGAVVGVDREGSGFVVRLEDGSVVGASRLLVATGLVDELPEVPGVAERFGREVLHCPYCHGWEVRDRPVAVLASDARAVHGALLWRQWTDSVTVLRHRFGPFGVEADERLAARGVAVVDGEVASLSVVEDRLVGAVLADGRRVAFEALVVAPRFAASAKLVADLGVAVSEQEFEGVAVASFVEADRTGRTSVPGVWVAGNVADPMAQVVSAADAGVRAAGAINADLVEAEVAEAVRRRRSALSL